MKKYFFKNLEVAEGDTIKQVTSVKKKDGREHVCNASLESIDKDDLEELLKQGFLEEKEEFPYSTAGEVLCDMQEKLGIEESLFHAWFSVEVKYNPVRLFQILLGRISRELYRGKRAEFKSASSYYVVNIEDGGIVEVENIDGKKPKYIAAFLTEDDAIKALAVLSDLTTRLYGAKA